MIPAETIAALRERVNLLELIGETVKLRKSGSQYRACCPFHTEKTPSFYVHPKKQLFKCHGCQVGGDAIEFVMRATGASFADAVKELGARFGVAVENGKGERYDPTALRAAWEERQREREAEEARKHARAAVRYQRVWENAGPADPNHPYLQRKGVDGEGLKQIGERLLVPMKAIEDNALMTVQVIAPDGFKRFARGGRALRTRTTIGKGAFKADGTLYLCEGYATGASIHAVTKAPVVVAFSAGNLTAIAKYLRSRYPVARIIVAADNDRWSVTQKGPNPGVIAADEAAAAIGGTVAIPDFQSLKGRPTDFNDLHQREGELAVRRWLSPEQSGEARTVDAGAATKAAAVPAPASSPEPEPAPPVDAPPPDIAPPEDPDDWRGAAPFRPLGFDRGTYYYLARATGQVTELRANQHDRKNLVSLAPLSWWGFAFPSKQGVEWEAAGDALLRACEAEGVYHPERLHGRGAWATSEHGPLLHLGDRLLVGDREVRPDAYRGRAVYERGVRLQGPADEPMELAEAQKLLELFHDVRWRAQETAPLLAAGWTALAPLCGALPWRPHVFLVAPAGSGKTTILEHLISPLMGGMGVHFQGGTTEAGIRQTLRADAMPVIVDEAEGGDQLQQKRVQGLLTLARDSSSDTGARVSKGTTHGAAMTFRVRSMFMFASIGGAVRAEADKTRVSVLQLKSREDGLPHERERHWAQLAPRIAEINEETGRRLIARTWRLLPQMLGRTGWLALFRRAAARVLGDARGGDQYGTLYCGAWSLVSDEAPTPAEAVDFLQTASLDEYVEDQVPDGIRALRVLMDQRERVEGKGQPRTLTIGELVSAVRTMTNPAADITPEDADRVLRQIGIRLSDDGENLFVAYASEWIGQKLRDTPYSDGWRTTLQGIPGAERAGKVRFTPLNSTRAVSVPLVHLTGDY